MTVIQLLEWPSSAINRAFQLLQDFPLDSLSVVDIGAHHGELVPLLAKTLSGVESISYHGYEPDSRNFEELKATIDSLSCDKLSTRIFPYAVSSASGSQLLYQSQSDVVSGLLEPEEELKERVTTGDHITVASQNIRTITIDSELSSSLSSDSLNILKVDTEGHDKEVLVGASTLLDKHVFDIVVCEFFSVRYRKNQAYLWDICSYLHGKGYLFDNLYDTRETTQGRLYTGNLIFVSDRISKFHSFL